METLIGHLEHALANFISLIKFVLEAIAAIVVLLGLIRTGHFVIKMNQGRRHPTFNTPLSFIQLRLNFGMWLALALEFQLGADILATTIAPNFTSLGRLAAIALIRTFLNYFLNKELQEEYEYQKTSSYQDMSQ